MLEDINDITLPSWTCGRLFGYFAILAYGGRACLPDHSIRVCLLPSPLVTLE